MHFLDLFWGDQEHHKIDPNSSRFCWNVTRCVSMFYSKSVKNELQDSVKCAKILKCQEKMSFQWGTNQTEKIYLPQMHPDVSFGKSPHSIILVNKQTNITAFCWLQTHEIWVFAQNCWAYIYIYYNTYIYIIYVYNLDLYWFIDLTYYIDLWHFMTKMFTVLKMATPWVGRSRSTSCGAHAWCFEWCFWKNSSNRLTSKISKGLPLYWTIDHSHFFLAWSGHSLAIFLAGTRELDTMGRRPAKCYRYNKNLSLEGLWIGAQGFAEFFIRT